MTLRIVLTPGARNDIDEIYRYIAERDGMTRAEAVLENLYAACSKLDMNPARGNIPKELWSFGTDEYREVHFKPYRIVYAIRGRKVIVHCILDGRRDMRTLLQRRLML